MKLQLWVVGKLKDAGLERLETQFLRRMRGAYVLEVREFRSQASLLNALRAPYVLLDERGTQVTSEELAAWIREDREHGARVLTFAIGDAHGFSEEARRGAHRVLALSRLTLPHRLARVVCVEQLYRASTILEGHPYHHP